MTRIVAVAISRFMFDFGGVGVGEFEGEIIGEGEIVGIGVPVDT
jgi:hypothetical protein